MKESRTCSPLETGNLLHLLQRVPCISDVLTSGFPLPVQRPLKRDASSEGLRYLVEDPQERLAGCHCRTRSPTLYSN
jgi:hypothetical protein